MTKYSDVVTIPRARLLTASTLTAELSYGYRRRRPFLMLFLSLIVVLHGCVPSGNDEVGPTWPDDYHVTITADPLRIPADGFSKSIISVEVVDKFGDPAAGVGVFLSASLGTLEAYEYNYDEGDWEKTDVPETSTQGRVLAYLTSSVQVGTSEVVAAVEDLVAKAYVNFL